MMDKNEVIKLMENAENLRVEKQILRMGRSRDSYFQQNDTIWDTLDNEECAFENFEFPGADYEIFQRALNECNFYPDLTLSDLISEIFNFYDQIIDEWKFEDKDLDKKMEELKEEKPESFKLMMEALESMNYKEFEEHDLSSYDMEENLFEDGYFDEWRDSETFDSLAYWTVFFKPDYDDVNIALEVGLVPFYYDGEFYLALGGCGMDLSPKLDAYMILTTDRVPEDSNLLRDEKYFKYVVGEDTFNKIMDIVKLNKPHYVVSFDA